MRNTKTHTPFDEWYEKQRSTLLEQFGLLAEELLKEKLFSAFCFGAEHKNIPR